MYLRKITILANLLMVSLFLTGNSYSQNADFDENAQVINSGHGGSHTSSVASWNTLPSSPHAVSRSCCVYINIGGVPYLYQFGGGNSNNELRRVARLNLNTNTWTNNYSAMPFSISSGTAIALRGDSIVYVFGGNTPTLGKTLKYNIYTNSWTVMANMPAAVTDALVLKYNETYIYIIGGGDGLFGANSFRTSAIQLYNTYTNSYSNVGNYPMACSMLGGGIYGDTIISVGGYVAGGNATANCYKGRVNLSNHTINWIAISSYPAGPIVRFASYIAVVGEGKGIICTGGAINGITPIASTYIWNFCTQSWQSGLPNNSQARSNFKASGKGDNKIYIVAGYTTTGVGTTENLNFSFIDGCSPTGIHGNLSQVPSEYLLSQNYPNPFNPATVISFGIPKAGVVKLTVSDISGKEVSKLVNDYKEAGTYKINFDASSLSSGIYFYKIESGTFVETKKMALLK
jgi:N-acetylneuraminic acid mutarotase